MVDYIPPPYYLPQPPNIVPPMPGYPGWGMQMPMPGGSQLPPGWLLREFNGQNYYLVPVHGVHVP